MTIRATDGTPVTAGDHVADSQLLDDLVTEVYGSNAEPTWFQAIWGQDELLPFELVNDAPVPVSVLSADELATLGQIEA